MGGALIILGVLLGAAVGGCLLGLAGVRWGSRRVIDAGIVVALLGYGGVGLIAAGVIPKAWVQRVDAGLFPVRPGETISPWREQMMLAAAEQGVLDVDHFEILLTSSASNRSIGNWGGSSVIPVCRSLQQGRLPEPYGTALADWLIQKWPLWSPGPNVLDEVAPAVLNSRSIPPEAKERFALFMVGVVQDPQYVVPHGWREAIGTAALMGRLSEGAIKKYLLAEARPRLQIQVRGAGGWVDPRAGGGTPQGTPAVPAGDVFAVVHERDNNIRSFHGKLPWRGKIRVVSGEQEFPLVGGWFKLVALPREFGPVAVLRAGETPGEQRVPVEVRVELTRDDLRNWFGANPYLRPDGFRIEEWTDVVAVREISVPYQVMPSTATAPGLEQGVEVQRVRECVEIGTPSRFGSGPEREMVVPITVTDPPVSFAMAVYWAREGHEVQIGWILAPEGVTSRFMCGGRVGAQGRGPARVVLRPDVSLLGRHEGVSAVYGGPELTFDVEYVYQSW